MRRIYESSALSRDDDDPHAPGERERDTTPRAMRSVPSGLLSRLFVPHRLRYRAISVSISTPDTEFPVGSTVPFRVTMKNALPFAVTLPVESPVLWNWHVDGHAEASHVPLRDPPDERRGFRFGRGERKQFTRRWSGSFKISESEWEPAGPGEHTIGAALNVPDAAEKGLAAETTVRLVLE
jgi:hypothetical protein